MTRLELKNVSKIYDDGSIAVNNVSFEINPGEFIVLVGPSGCGKTTILRMIAGLEPISKGDILIGNRVVNQLPSKDRNIAMVFQNYALYPHLSVYENMAFGLRIRKIDKKEIDQRIKKAAEILGLTDYLSKKPKALSGGQRQRVAVGRAIVREPEVFLFDEPLSNLDAKLRVQMRTEISRLHKELKTTMIYVTHDQVEAMTMGDRIIVLKDGFVQQIEAPMNLYNNPANKFVAGFIGTPSMNFIKGELISSDNNLFFLTESKKLKVPLPARTKEYLLKQKIEKVWLGVRPEDIFVVNNEVTNDENIIKSEIQLIEPLGNQTLIYFNFEGQQLVCEYRGFLSSKNESNIRFALNTDKIYLFDEKSKERII